MSIGTDLHLTRKELEQRKGCADNVQWDAEYAKIVNAVCYHCFRRTHCAVHAVRRHWDAKKHAAFGDIQMRVYIGNWSILDIGDSLRKNDSLLPRR